MAARLEPLELLKTSSSTDQEDNFKAVLDYIKTEKMSKTSLTKILKEIQSGNCDRKPRHSVAEIVP